MDVAARVPDNDSITRLAMKAQQRVAPSQGNVAMGSPVSPKRSTRPSRQFSKEVPRFVSKELCRPIHFVWPFPTVGSFGRIRPSGCSEQWRHQARTVQV